MIVADFIAWARANAVPVGPGRGSGAGSLVAFALGITDLDPIEHDLLFGNPADEIVEFAKQKQIDLIVMGSRGLSDIKGLFLGSVSHKVSHLAECTCITVK